MAWTRSLNTPEVIVCAVNHGIVGWVCQLAATGLPPSAGEFSP